MKVKHLFSTLLIIRVIGSLWAYLEQMIYGASETRVVDTIIIILISPFFYITSVWWDEHVNNK